MSVEGVEWNLRIKRVSLFEKVTTKQRHKKKSGFAMSTSGRRVIEAKKLGGSKVQRQEHA